MSAGTVSIRDAQLRDAEPVAQLITWLGYPLSPTLAAELLASFAAEARSRVQVAEAADAVVGVIATHVVPRLDSDRCCCRIVDLVVAPDSRRLGVGRMLVHAAELEARRQGASRVDLSTREARHDARRFYARLGFEQHSRGLLKRLEG